METVWTSIGDSALTEGGSDGVFVPIPEAQLALLRAALLADMDEDEDEVDQQYWLERLEATHWFIYVAVPDDLKTNPDFANSDACTWWDFGAVMAKSVDGVWYLWAEDPSDTGNIWYQSPYTKTEAYEMRDLCVRVASTEGLYNPISEDHTYETSVFYETAKRECKWFD